MEEMIRVNAGGDILDIPVSVFTNDKQFAWWNQVGFSNDPKITARAKVGWDLYNARANGVKPTPTLSSLHRGKYRYWLRNKLTKWGVI